VLAVATLAYPDHQKKKGLEWSKPAQIGALVLNILFQLATAVANVVASWFGPVSIVAPTTLGSMLLFSMIMFGLIVRLEKFSKETRVGTYMITVAVVLLPVVGPEAQEGQDILHLLSQPLAATWSALLIAASIVSTVGLVFIAKRVGEGTMEKKTKASFICNLVAQTAAGVLGLSLARMLILVTGPALVVTIILAGISGAIQGYACILQSTTVNQNTFVPASTAANIAANALTGIIVWRDLATVQSGVGYVCTFILMILGIYLLSDLDLCADLCARQDTDIMSAKQDTDSMVDEEIEGMTNSLQVSPIDKESTVSVDYDQPIVVDEEVECMSNSLQVSPIDKEITVAVDYDQPIVADHGITKRSCHSNAESG